MASSTTDSPMSPLLSDAQLDEVQGENMVGLLYMFSGMDAGMYRDREMNECNRCHVKSWVQFRNPRNGAPIGGECWTCGMEVTRDGEVRGPPREQILT